MLLFALACAAPDPTAGLPEDGFVVGTPAAVASLARCMSRFPDSESARLGGEWAAQAEACSTTLFAQGGRLQLTCGAPGPGLQAALADNALRFGLPRTEAGMVSGSVRSVGPSALAATVLVPVPDPAGPLALLLPGGEAAGPAMLSGQGAFLQARGRPEGGIAVAEMVPAESQADQLFDLRSSMLSGAVLQGTWELAAYAPAAGYGMPQVVLGLGVRPLTAPAALAAFAETLREKWSVRREEITAEAWRGECLRGLNIMPEFEPCFLLRDDALAIGWNEAAVRHGTAEGVRATFPTGVGVVVDTEALAASDAVLAASLPPELQYPALDYPLGRIRLDARREGAYLAVDVAAGGCP